MQCARFREAISARLDGEPLGMPAAELDDHLAGCAGVHGLGRDAATVTRRARLAPSPAMPDLTAAVLAALPRELPGAAAAARTRLVDAALRLALVAVAVAQAGLAWPALVSGAGAMSAPVHMAHETGAWNLAVAAAFLAVAAVAAAGGRRAAVPGLLRRAAGAGHARRPGAGHVHADRAVAHLLLVGRGRGPRGRRRPGAVSRRTAGAVAWRRTPGAVPA